MDCDVIAEHGRVSRQGKSTAWKVDVFGGFYE